MQKKTKPVCAVVGKDLVKSFPSKKKKNLESDISHPGLIMIDHMAM